MDKGILWGRYGRHRFKGYCARTSEKSLELGGRELAYSFRGEKTIDDIAKDAMGDASKRHLRIKESAFVYVIPCLFEQMKAKTGPEAARKSLLSESWRNMREFSEASPARGRGHPFGKLLGTKPPAIMKQWKGEAGVALTQPCPDFALRSPFPKIVFEAKYFPKGDREAAESALVTGIYQAFFYRRRVCDGSAGQMNLTLARSLHWATPSHDPNPPIHPAEERGRSPTPRGTETEPHP